MNSCVFRSAAVLAAVMTAGVVYAGPFADARAAGLATAHAPVVSSVSPAAGPVTGGGTVTVLGRGFTHLKAVKFGTAAGTRVKVVSSGKLTVTVPARATGTVDVRVTTAAGTSAVSAHDKYAYDARPSVSSVSPSTGPEAAGTVVTVHGKGFTAVKSVLFGSVAGSRVKVVSATALTVAGPAHAAGTVDVRVTTPGGTSAVTVADHYSFRSPLSPVTSLKAATVTATAVTLTWLNPAVTGFAGVMIRRAQGARPPTSTSSGTLVASTGSSVTSHTDSSLAPGTEYSYALFAEDGSAYSAAATITISTGQPPAVDVSGTLAQNTTWSPAGASAYLLQGNVDVPAGITLTIEPGTIIKAAGTMLSVEGTLDVAGTGSAPVVFTSVNDNSVGGVTGSGSPATGDWSGIWVDNGSVDIEHASIAFAMYGVGGGSGSGSVVVDDSRLSSVSTGLTSDQPFGIFSTGVFGAFTATGDTITSGADGVDVISPEATVTGNVISSGGSGIVVDAGGALSVSAAVVENNTVTAAGRPYAVVSPGLDFAELATNSMGASAVPQFVVAGSVGPSQTMPAEAYPWVMSIISNSGGVAGVGLDVPSGVTLTVAAGAVVKATGDDEYFPARVTVEGTLDVAGTGSAPVVFTSVNDNSVGGDTGSGSPAAADWSGISVNGGSIDIEYATLEYAATAVSFSGTSGLLSAVTIANSTQAVDATAGALSLRGQLSGDTYDVAACDWGAGCSVDAAYVNWGTSAGPFPSGQPSLACGAVTVTPWIGADSSVTSNLWAVGNCDGTNSPSTALATAQDNFNTAIAGLQIDCSGDMESACQQIQTDQACYSSLEQVAWSNVSIGGIPATPPDNGDVADVFNSWLETAENPVLSGLGYVSDFGKDIYQAVDLYSQLTSAYNSCT
jgi:hypothetical protein